MYHRVQWNARFIATTRQRYPVTLTPELARAFDRAARRRPVESRSTLLLRLIDMGEDTLTHELLSDDDSHHAAALSSGGRYAGA